GDGASGSTSRISARRSVYFHSSIRRFGSPARSKASKASRRASATLPEPGKRSRATVNTSFTARPVSVFAKATFIPNSVASGCELRVAGLFQLQRQLLATAFDDLALRHHMHEVRDDVVQKPLIVGDHHHRTIGRAQRVDAVGGDPQRVDVEAG